MTALPAPLDNRAPLHNLPAQASSFIGRESELAAVRALAAGSRLVTLTGAGGAGKTRLALRVATGLADETRDGAWFADLAPLGDPDLVAVTVADVLGIRMEPGRPALEELTEAVGRRSLLVLLDNCEHVIEGCAKLADALLRGCPNLLLLTTSREPLDVGGERVYRVPSMGLPPEGAGVAEIRASEAVRLLADRAAAQGVTLDWDEPSAQVVGRICRRLDGIPLALELAAARLRVLPASAVEDRLNQRFALLTGGSRAALPRQQTLRAVVDWSWELLSVPERATLARLSVFAGGFGLAGAEAVAAGPGVPAAEVLGLLGALVDKSLVQFGDTGTGPDRYRLLETVRHYAAGQLEALGPSAAEAARRAHRDYCLALAETAAPQLRSAGQAEWLDRLDTELDNLRAAIAFSLSGADPEPGLRLAASLRSYWTARGHTAEAADMLRALLDAPGAKQPTRPRARALACAGIIALRTSGLAIAGDYCQEAMTIARATGDEHLVAELLYLQAAVLLRRGQTGAALPLLESGLALARRLQEPSLTASMLDVRSHAAYVAGDHASAVRDTTEALRLFRQAGDQIVAGQMLDNLGYYLLSAGDVDAARRNLAEALDIARAFNDRHGIGHRLYSLGLAEYLGGAPDAAQARFAESLELTRRVPEKRTTAYLLIGLALAAYSEARPDWPARLHGAADQALAARGETIEPLEGRLVGRDRERLRTAMGDEAFEAAYTAGQTLDQDQVLAELGHLGAAAGQARPAAPSATVTALTPRELDVLRLVAQGLSNPDIARRLILSEHTVHRHLANILRKLGQPSRAAAAAWGVRAGLV